MNEKSSVEKGDELENKTFQIISKILQNDDFYVSGKKSKIFQKKAYYSRDRESNIIFDLTIETYLDNSKEYSILTILECKNYGKSVQVSDIESFESKIRQISEHNTKGIVVANGSFQSGAYKLAKSKGIGLMRLFNNDEYEWIAKRENESHSLSDDEIDLKFQYEKLESDETFFAGINNTFFRSLSESLIHLEIIDSFIFKESLIDIPFKTEEFIDNIVNKLQANKVYSGRKLDENKICDFLTSKYETLEFDLHANLPKGTLGKIEFKRLKISINKDFDKDFNRRRFTLAHEIGHLLLHKKILENKIAEKEDTVHSLSHKYNVSELSIRRLEFQANMFASHLLLPTKVLLADINEYFHKENIRKGFLYWDNQHGNQNLVLTLLNTISKLYEVSIEVARIRLISLNLLKDERYKSMKTIMHDLNYL